MVLQLNLIDLKGNKPLLNLLKKLKYIEVREVKKELSEAELEHEELKAGLLMQSQIFLGNYYDKL